ncbi:MAG: SRPBCC family protein [Terriglobales bacterium]
MTTSASPATEDLTLQIQQVIQVRASLEATFAALIEQLGRSNETMDGAPMHLKLEAWPGGRWFRDLGDGNGHFWGVVQAIKRPTLLEICGPLMMSSPVANNVQYRLSRDHDHTVITFRHTGFGLVQDEHRQGMPKGWSHIHEQVKLKAEKAQ